jgi:hypothetical protein
MDFGDDHMRGICYLPGICFTSLIYIFYPDVTPPASPSLVQGTSQVIRPFAYILMALYSRKNPENGLPPTKLG